MFNGLWLILRYFFQWFWGDAFVYIGCGVHFGMCFHGFLVNLGEFSSGFVLVIYSGAVEIGGFWWYFHNGSLII